MTILRPSIQPDEIAMGYAGRLQQRNGWANQGECMQALLKWADAKTTSLRVVPAVELLAQAASKTTPQFVKDYTTLPLRRAVVGYTPSVAHGCADGVGVLWTVALRATRPGVYFCKGCVEQDLRAEGSPYWRREHQLPGVFWCSTHSTALSRVDASDAYLRSPSEFVVSAVDVDSRWVESLKASVDVRRFLAICTHLLASNAPLKEGDVRGRLYQRCEEINVHPRGGGANGRHLSDVVRQRFDAAWLSSVLPGMASTADKRHGSPQSNAIVVSGSGRPPILYALIYASLYESAAEAISAMTAQIPAPPRQASQQKGEQHLEAQSLLAAYVAAGGKHCVVPAPDGLSSRCKDHRLRALGLPALGRSEAADVHAVVADILAGKYSLDQACARHRVPVSIGREIFKVALGPFDAALAQMLPKKTTRRPYGPRRRPAAPPQAARETAKGLHVMKGKAIRARVPETA